MAQNTHRIVVPNEEFQGQSTITHVSFGDACVGVGDKSFADCSELSKINDNNVIETIGVSAFAHTSLISAIFPAVKTIGNNAFEGCKELIRIDINNGCTYIGDRAFRQCEKLTDVTIPNNENFTTINEETFCICASLSKIIIPNNVTKIGIGAFKQCEKLTDVTIGSNVETIGTDAFNLCSTLPTVSIPDSVTTIGSGAFKQCYSITSVKIGKSVTSIGDGAFSECSSLTDVELNCKNVGSWFSKNGTIKKVGIGENVSTIGTSAFTQCSNLTTATIGENVSSIGDGAFSECSSLTDVTYITNSDVTNSPITNIGKNAFEKCSNFTWVQIPDSVETIGDGAFNNCTNLSGIYVGKNVSSIGDGAFSECSNIKGVYTNDLTKWCNINFGNSDANPVTNSKTLFLNNEEIIDLEIPDGVETIKKYAFYNCKNIKSIKIPSSLTTIEDNAFYGSNDYTDDYNGCKNHVIINYSESFKDMEDYKGKDESIYGYIAKYAHAVIAAAANYGSFIFDWNGKLVQYAQYYDKNVKIDLIFPNEATFQTGEKIQDYVVDSKLFKIIREGKCDDIISVTILENSAEEFENNVFDGCTNLSELIINYSDTPLKLGYKYHNTKIDENGNPQTGEGLFYDCQNIKNITLNRNLDYDAYAKKEYGYSPFSGIKSNFNVTIGNDVTKIGNLLFYYSGINNITIGENVTEIGGSAFEMCQKLNGKVIIPNSVQTIGACAFYNCDKLTSVTLPKNDNFKTINERLFYHCDTLVDVTIPDSVTTIGDYAFEKCKSLTNITFDYKNSKIETIGNSSFEDCEKLESVYIPNSMTKIGKNAFKNCENIKYITIGNDMGDESFGEDSFRSSKTKYHEVINFSKIEIPNTKGKINEEDEKEVYISKDYGYVVYGASYLLNAIDGSQIGDFIFGKKETEDTTFSLLRYLRDGGSDSDFDDIPENYKNLYDIPENYNGEKYIIAEGVFSGHKEIESIKIPVGVFTIENDVFNGCSNLKEMSIVYCDDKTELVLGHINNNDEKTNGLLYETNIETFYLDRNIDYNTEESISPLYNKTTLTTVTIGDHVTEINQNLFWGCENLVKLKNSDDNDIIIGKNVKSIGKNSFRECKRLTKVVIPDSVTSIGSGAFYNCSSLQDVGISKNITKINDHTFWSCNSLKEVNIPNKVTSIEHYAFEACSSLRSVGIPDSVERIGLRAFFNCDAIENVTITDLLKWCKITFNDESSTPMSSHIYVEPKLYLDNTLVEHLEIPEDINVIKNFTFLGCHSLKIVEIHNLVESIGSGAFKYCKNITDVIIKGNNDLVINEESFGWCENLTNIRLYNVKEICDDAFIYSGNIKNVYITNLSNWCNIDFKNETPEDKCYSAPMWGGINEEQRTYTSLYLNDEIVKELEIPSGITDIKNYTFYGCHSLEKVTINKDVESISDKSFYGCYNLKTVINFSPSFYIIKGGTDKGYVGFYANRVVNAPNGKFFGDFLFGTEEVEGKKCDYLCGYIGNDTKIELPEKSPEEFPFGGGEYAIVEDVFLDYNDIVSVKIPNTVVSIGKNAFSGCTRLTNITIPGYINENGEAEGYIGFNAFNKCSCLTSVTIGNGCDSIDENAFSECYNLKRLVLGKNVITTCDNILNFYNSNNPKEMLLNPLELLIHFCPVSNNINGDLYKTIINYYEDDGGDVIDVKEYDNWMYFCGEFNDSIFEPVYSATKLCCYMGDDSELIIPKLSTDDYNYYIIGKYSFAYMNNITSITITEDVNKIEDYAFKDCIGLKRIVIENDKENIFNSYTNVYNYDIFKGCKNYICIDFSNTNTNTNIEYFSDCGCVEYIYESGGFIVDDFIFNLDDKNIKYIKIYIGNDTELELPELPEFEDGYIFDNNFHYIDGIDDDKNDGDYKDYICTSIKISDSVTIISDEAFVNFKNLTKIEIGKRVTSIGNDIFREIYKLNEILIDEDNGRYSSRDKSNENCNAIINKNTNTLIYGCNTTTIPNDGTVTAIGEYAFIYTPDLVSIEIPESVTYIATEAFYGCYFTEGNFKILNRELDEVKKENGYWGATIVDFETDDGLLIKGNTVISCRTWATEVNIPETITFEESNEHSVTKTVTSIGKNAFNVCDALTSVTIPNSVTSIGETAFAYITSLKTVTIYEGKNSLSIGDYAFENCIGINEITIPKNTSKVNRAPFYGCIFPNGKFTNNSNKDFYYWVGSSNPYDTSTETDDGLIIKDNKVIYCRPWATSVTIPNSVTSIGDNIFKNCYNLTSVIIPDSVVSIGEGAFENCTSLTSVTIPNKVTSIGKKAFYWCNNLTSVTLTNNKDKETGNYESIGISGIDSKTIGIGAFTHVSNNFKIYVPNELITDYINNAEWKYYFEHIEGYDIKEEPEQ